MADTNILNPNFESETLAGWTVISGNAFSVSNQTNYGDLQEYGFSELWHLCGSKTGAERTGVLVSETFTLEGDGYIDFLIGGTNDIDNVYVALVRASDDVELMKATSNGSDKYQRLSWDASAYVGEICYIKLVDNSTTGYLNFDDIRVPPTPSLHGHLEPSIYNPNFEYNSLPPTEIQGWTLVSGDAFLPENLSHEIYYSSGGAYNQNGSYFLTSLNASGDDAVGEIHSSIFTLGGNGGIDFLISGGNDIDNLYVALIDVETGNTLFKATGNDTEEFRRVFWDASSYIGQDCYIKIVDSKNGGWGHINADDFHVYDSAYASGLYGIWKLDEGKGTVSSESISGYSAKVNYALSEGIYQAPLDPMWISDGIQNSALYFDGYSTWISYSPAVVPAPSDAITIEAWVAPKGYEHGDGRLTAIINQHNVDRREGYLFGFYRHGTWGLQFGDGSKWHEIMSDDLIPMEEWSYLVATYDSSMGEAVLYLNGQKSTSADFTPGLLLKPCVTELMLGRNNQGAWLYGFELHMYCGLMDEVKLFNRALSSQEVFDSYSSYMNELNGNLPTAQLRVDRDILANDMHRPSFHAQPPCHWQNEPSGPLYFEGRYHLFYQSNPRGPFWEHIRWGHIISDDMIHWRDAKDAIIPERYMTDPDGAWAGGSIIDGNGVPTLFYTAGDDRRHSNQSIHISRSQYPSDGDRDLNYWKKDVNDAVVQTSGQGRLGEFRDPFVFKDGDSWIMLVTSGIDDGQRLGGTALVYETNQPELNEWGFKGELMVGDYNTYPLTGRVWELPILLPLGQSGKHIFLINPAMMESSEYQSRFVWHWIGVWDKASYSFTPDNPEPQLLDVGMHFTGPAGLVTPDGRSVIFSIAQGRRPALQDYKGGFAHSCGMPWSVSLRDDGRLMVEAIQEIESLRGNILLNIDSNTSFANANSLLSNIQGDMLEIQCVIAPGIANEVGITVRRTPDAEEETTIYYKVDSQELWVNRIKSTLNSSNDKWMQGGMVDIGNEDIILRIFVDRSLIEATLNNHKNLTTRVYPTRKDALGIQIWGDDNTDSIAIRSLTIWQMNSAYIPVANTGISINPPTATLYVGQNTRLTPSINPENANNKDVIWTSSSPQIATVINGKVIAISEGTATIMATTRDGNYSAAANVTIQPESIHNV